MCLRGSTMCNRVSGHNVINCNGLRPLIHGDSIYFCPQPAHLFEQRMASNIFLEAKTNAIDSLRYGCTYSSTILVRHTRSLRKLLHFCFMKRYYCRRTQPSDLFRHFRRWSLLELLTRSLAVCHFKILIAKCGKEEIRSHECTCLWVAEAGINEFGIENCSG